jgi:hypothetical protein
MAMSIQRVLFATRHADTTISSIIAPIGYRQMHRGRNSFTCRPGLPTTIFTSSRLYKPLSHLSSYSSSNSLGLSTRTSRADLLSKDEPLDFPVSLPIDQVPCHAGTHNRISAWGGTQQWVPPEQEQGDKAVNNEEEVPLQRLLTTGRTMDHRTGAHEGLGGSDTDGDQEHCEIRIVIQTSSARPSPCRPCVSQCDVQWPEFHRHTIPSQPIERYLLAPDQPERYALRLLSSPGKRVLDQPESQFNALETRPQSPLVLSRSRSEPNILFLCHTIHRSRSLFDFVPLLGSAVSLRSVSQALHNVSVYCW